MNRPCPRLLATALVTFALSALCGPGCSTGNDTALAGPDKLAEARNARGASLKGEADGPAKSSGLAKSSRRR